MSIEFTSNRIEKNIPGREFPKVNVEIDGEKKTLGGIELKKFIMKFVHGGKSRGQTNEYLKKIGVEGNQIKKREEILKLLDDEFSGVDNSSHMTGEEEKKKTKSFLSWFK